MSWNGFDGITNY